MPTVAAGVPVRWTDPAAPWIGAVGGSPSSKRFAPAVVARVALQYDDTKADLLHHEEYEAVLFPLTAHPDASTARAFDYDDRDLRTEAPTSCSYALTDAPIGQKQFFTGVQRNLVDTLARSRSLQILTNRELRLFSRPGESAELFASRCSEAANAKADDAMAALRDKYETKARRIADQLDVARDRVEVLKSEQESRRNSELISGVGDVLGGLLGGRNRKVILGKLGTAAGRRGRTSTAGARVDAAENKVGTLEEQLQDLDAELAGELIEIDEKWEAVAQQITPMPIALERTDVKVTQLMLTWVPVDRTEG
jgi:hypothetical protein